MTVSYLRVGKSYIEWVFNEPIDYPTEDFCDGATVKVEIENGKYVVYIFEGDILKHLFVVKPKQKLLPPAHSSFS